MHILETLLEDIEVLTKRIQSRQFRESLEVRLENSPKYHSAANGMVENAVQRVIGLTRVLKDALEASIKQAIEPNIPVMTFMVNHAATIIHRFSVGQDGKMPLKEARGDDRKKIKD